MIEPTDKHRETARQIVIDGFDTVSRFPNAKVISEKLKDAIATALATTEADAYARGRGEAAEIARRELQHPVGLVRLEDWPLSDVLFQMATWIKHLGSAHDCDCHGWEAQSFLINAALQHQDAILASSPGPTYEERVRAEIAEKVKALPRLAHTYEDEIWLVEPRPAGPYLNRDDVLAAIRAPKEEEGR